MAAIFFSKSLTNSVKVMFFLGEPNNVGRDGSVPIMVCLVPLINKDPLHHFTHTMKVRRIRQSVHVHMNISFEISRCVI